MYSIIFFFPPFGCPRVGGCPSPGACWAYPRASPEFAPSNFALVADQEDLNNMNGSKLQVWEIFEALNWLVDRSFLWA